MCLYENLDLTAVLKMNFSTQPIYFLQLKDQLDVFLRSLRKAREVVCAALQKFLMAFLSLFGHLVEEGGVAGELLEACLAVAVGV